ncbi:MAG: hypothetical protein Q8P67_23225 [archaeon]|nr:hypothetical protein [archaeon]
MTLSKRHDSLLYKLSSTPPGSPKSNQLGRELSEVTRQQAELKYLLKNAWIDCVARANGIHRTQVSLLPRAVC